MVFCRETNELHKYTYIPLILEFSVNTVLALGNFKETENAPRKKNNVTPKLLISDPVTSNELKKQGKLLVSRIVYYFHRQVTSINAIV